jgi:site-specific DNA-methyltransferase (adenine-specific)
MGKSWDKRGIAYNVDMWRECLRVLKPGGHMLAFSSTRTYHRMTCAIEDAGFEIRDQIGWMYGSGFPKSKNIETPSGKWGTALKPAHEPICVARKPLCGTVEENLNAYGTGALNIDGCRVGTEDTRAPSYKMTSKGLNGQGFGTGEIDYSRDGNTAGSECGRWPANIIHDGSEEIVALFPKEAGAFAPVKGDEPSSVTKAIYGQINRRLPGNYYDDDGSAARFFYCAKASRQDRNYGLINESIGEALTQQHATMRERENADWQQRNGNFHPTVKPISLMRYLCRLVTPPGGVVLDHFMGSGSTGVGAVLEGFRFIGGDGEPLYFPISTKRVEEAHNEFHNTTQDMFEAA